MALSPCRDEESREDYGRHHAGSPEAPKRTHPTCDLSWLAIRVHMRRILPSVDARWARWNGYCGRGPKARLRNLKETS